MRSYILSGESKKKMVQQEDRTKHFFNSKIYMLVGKIMVILNNTYYHTIAFLNVFYLCKS